MTSEEYQDILYKYFHLRWIARFLATIEIALLTYIVGVELLEEFNNQSPLPFLTLLNGQYFLAITLTVAYAGLILAYWKEGMGGSISLASYLVLFIGWADFHVVFILGMTLAALPAILYLVYGICVYREVKHAEKD